MSVPTEFYWIFLGFALVGLGELGFFIYRIFRQSELRDRLTRARDHLDVASEEGTISEEFYERQRSILEGEAGSR